MATVTKRRVPTTSKPKVPAPVVTPDIPLQTDPKLMGDPNNFKGGLEAASAGVRPAWPTAGAVDGQPAATTPQSRTIDEQAARDWVYNNIDPNMVIFFDKPGDVGDVLRRAVSDTMNGRGEWSKLRLTTTIKGTPEWRNGTVRGRNMQDIRQNNPGQWNQMLSDQIYTLQKAASKFGISVSDADARRIAEDQLNNGWENDVSHQTQLLLSRSDAGAGPGMGSIGGDTAKIQALYRTYGLPIDQATAVGMARKIADQTLDIDVINEQVKAQAKAKFPHMAGAIDSGLTPEQYNAPYKEVLARELEINSSQIDFNDPNWSPVVDGGTTGKPMTLTEAARWARQKPEWQKTDRANAQAASSESFFLRQFGKLA